ncbi:major facilitator superfamily domain-containing protein [Xylaria sp. FL0064]|nr:major facilitator superfamily domain-containing protein [Xylaria sp. FL0064]
MSTPTFDIGEPGERSWQNDAENPYNWPKWKKNLLLASTSIVALAGSLGTSIITPAHDQIIKEYGVSDTVAFLPLTTYVLALGLGPVVGGPLSETAGRKPVYIISCVCGGLFALGAGLTTDFAGFCILRFLSGFVYGPSLAIGTGMLAETYTPKERGWPSSLYILSPFLGPSLGPVLGVFLVHYKGWRWTQYVLVLFSVFSLAWVLVTSESYHSVIQRRRKKRLGIDLPEPKEILFMLRQFVTLGLFRPLHMMDNYIRLCDKLFYQQKIHMYPPHQVPPEYRLLPAMIGSLALPVSLFLFAWTTCPDISSAVPILATVLFGAVNVSMFVASIQYVGDVYHRTNVASATSANSLGRYCLAAVSPLFSLQLYRDLGVSWATSTLGFISVVLLPLAWMLFRFGKLFRDKSRYETASY